MRAAGNSGFYELAIVDGAGNIKGRTCKLPSVTTILKALPKNGLDWWGYKIGLLEGRKLGAADTLAAKDDDDFYDAVKSLAREGKAQTPRTVLTSAGGRGTDVHDLAEQLFESGELPPPSQIDPEQLPFVKALWKFYKDMGEMNMEVVAVEVPVFSLEHRFAGTLDLILKQPLHPSDDSIYHLLDFKTSKAVYESHLLQLAAYEYAAREMGYIPEDAEVVKSVVRLGKTKYQVKNSECTIEDFLAVKRVWEWLESMSPDRREKAGV